MPKIWIQVPTLAQPILFPTKSSFQPFYPPSRKLYPQFLLCCHCHCSLGPRLSTNKIQQSTNFTWDISNTAFYAAYWWMEFSSHPQNRLTNSQHTYKFKKEILVLLHNRVCDCSLHRACWPLQSHFISVSLYLTLYLPILFLSVNAGHLSVHQTCQRGCCVGITFTYGISQL